jgi:hypothetical protein
MGLADLFYGSQFQRTIKKYCDQHGWKIADLKDDRATLRFEMESGSKQILYIIKFDTTLEFSVPSMFGFADVDEVPHRVSTHLLQESQARKIGFWCIEKIGGKLVFSIMHNAEINLLDAEYFGKVVRALINGCEKFEQELRKR